MTRLWLSIALGISAMLLACGGSSNSLSPTTPSIQSIQITPSSPSIPAGKTQQFSASAKYSDGSSKDVTGTASWSSSNSGAATISPGGVATAKAVGISTITATTGTVSGSATLAVTAPALTSITVAPSTVSVPAGTTKQFTATGSYSDGSTQDVTSTATWNSSNSGVATITPGGLATAKVVGTSTITATLGAISGTALLTINSATLTSIAVTPANPSIPLGILQPFTAIGTYSDGTSSDISKKATWSSSNSAVASITAAGLATARNLGNTIIQAVLGTISGATNLNVNVANLALITIADGDTTIAENTSHVFTAIGLFSDGGTRNISANVTWTSSSPTVATMSGHNPVAKGSTAGSTTIRAALGSASASVNLKVTDALIQFISVTPVGETIARTTTLPYFATGTFSDSTTQPLNLDVIWSSSNSGVATINGPVAQGVAKGSTQIRAGFGGKSGSTTLRVSSANLTSLAISPATTLIAPASTEGFSATGMFSDGSTQSVSSIAAWSSSNPTVATINNFGLATGQSAGTTTITAQIGSVSATAMLTIPSSPLAAISITPAVGSVPQGIGLPFTATGIFADGTQQSLTNVVTWVSSPLSFATISNLSDSKGVATGVAVGQATITAVFGGVVGVATLNVNDATLDSIDVTPSEANVALGNRLQFSASGHFSDGTILGLTNQVMWASSDVTVAVITPKGGTMSSAGVGTAMIDATLDGVSGSTNLTVH